MALIYFVFGVIILSLIYALTGNGCKHKHWVEKIVESKIPGYPNITNVFVVYKCTKCGDIRFINPLKHKKNDAARCRTKEIQ